MAIFFLRYRGRLAPPSESETWGEKVVELIPVQYPSSGEEATMRRLGILFDGQPYRYEACRYEQSRDAARYVIDHVTACEVPASVGPQPSADERHLDDLIDAALVASFPASGPISPFVD